MILKELIGRLIELERKGAGEYETVVSFNNGHAVANLEDIYLDTYEKTIYLGE